MHWIQTALHCKYYVLTPCDYFPPTYLYRWPLFNWLAALTAHLLFFSSLCSLFSIYSFLALILVVWLHESRGCTTILGRTTFQYFLELLSLLLNLLLVSGGYEHLRIYSSLHVAYKSACSELFGLDRIIKTKFAEREGGRYALSCMRSEWRRTQRVIPVISWALRNHWIVGGGRACARQRTVTVSPTVALMSRGLLSGSSNVGLATQFYTQSLFHFTAPSRYFTDRYH